jgi:hypothetical protein
MRDRVLGEEVSEKYTGKKHTVILGLDEKLYDEQRCVLYDLVSSERVQDAVKVICYESSKCKQENQTQNKVRDNKQRRV